MKASSASSRRARPAAIAAQPFTTLRFRVAIEGLPGTGAVEVVPPAARIVQLSRKRRTVQYEALVIRRGLTLSTAWFDWWHEARRTARALKRDVQVILLDGGGNDALRWSFPACVPAGYSLSPLNALAGAAVIESLELQVGDFRIEPPT